MKAISCFRHGGETLRKKKTKRFEDILRERAHAVKQVLANSGNCLISNNLLINYLTKYDGYWTPFLGRAVFTQIPR